MAEKRDNVAVKYKDNVFCMLYREKENLLDLYNALRGSNYTNVDDLQVTTLNGGSYMKYKNDALKVQVININKDVDILSKCETLRGYMTFVNKTRYKTQVERKDVKQAVLEAIDECMEENILVDFFEKHREEVVEVSIYDYDEEKVRKTLADEAREEGVAEGIKEGIEKGEIITKITMIIKKVEKSKSLLTIASELEEEEADIKPLYDAVVASAPDYDIEEIKVKLNI